MAASGGNFGLAVGHAARELGHRAEIFVPSTSPVSKIDRVRATGAEVRVVEGYYDDASRPPPTRQEATGAVWMHPFDQPEVVAGQGTIGRRALPAGTRRRHGGRQRGRWRSDRRDRGLVRERGRGGGHRARDLHVSRERLGGRRTRPGVEVAGIAADSLGARRSATSPSRWLVQHVGTAVTVTDDAIREAQRAIWREFHLIAEPGGATALAALMASAYRPRSGERIVVLVCGANGDPAPVHRRLSAPPARVGSPAVTHRHRLRSRLRVPAMGAGDQFHPDGRPPVGHGVLPRRVPAEVRRQPRAARPAARRPRRWQRSTT